MDETQQRMERQCDNKAAQHGHKRNGKYTALVILALKSVADDRLSDGQRHHRIQNTGGLDDQVGDTHFILRHHAGVETQHEDNENLGTERAYREDKGIAEKAFVLIHFLPFLSRSVWHWSVTRSVSHAAMMPHSTPMAAPVSTSVG